MRLPAKHFYEFGPFRLDPVERLLYRDGEVVPLTAKVFDILLVFVQNSGRTLSKEELMSQVWPDQFIEEGNLTRNVSTLRKALDEGPDDHRYIVTVPGRGYRFVAPVEELNNGSVEPVVAERPHTQIAVAVGQGIDPDDPPNPIRPKRWREVPTSRWLLALAALIVAGCGFWVARITRQPDASVSPVRRMPGSIAVLPFKPLVADKRDEVMEMGMADTLITKLGSLRQFIVRPISAVRRYTALDQDPLAAGREQKVEAVLEASYYWTGERIRVTARLIDVRDGSTLRAYQCDSYCTDIFTAQDIISEKVASELVRELTGEERKLLAKRYTENIEAYKLYALGRFYWNKRTEDDLKKGIEYFQQAVDKDPNYALAYAGLAESYATLVGLAYSDPEEFLPKVKAYAVKALTIDNTLAEAHSPLAAAKNWEWDWLGAEKEFKQAIELNYGYAMAHKWYSLLLARMGRFEESFAEIEQALTIDPVSLIGNQGLGLRFYYARRDDRAIEQLRKTLEMDPNFLPALITLGEVYTHQRKYAEAIAELNKAAGLSRDSALAALGYTYAASGKRSKARQALAELREMSKRRYVSPVDVAAIYTGLGEKDQAFAWLEKGFQGRAVGMSFLKIDPKFDSLRSDPRFADLLRRIGLPQ